MVYKSRQIASKPGLCPINDVEKLCKNMATLPILPHGIYAFPLLKNMNIYHNSHSPKHHMIQAGMDTKRCKNKLQTRKVEKPSRLAFP